MSTIQQFNDFKTDIKQGILWQYNDAKNLLALINKKQEFYDQYLSSFFTAWLTYVFDLRTANVFGLQLWAMILDIPLLVAQEPYIPRPTFGFNAFVITNMSDTSILSVGMEVSGDGIASGTVITQIQSSTIIEISELVTDTGTKTFTFSLQQTCDTTDTTDSIIVENSSVLSVGMGVSGVGIPVMTTISSIDSPTTITISNNATATGTEALTFSISQDGDITAPALENDYENFENGTFSDFNVNLVLSAEEERFLLRLRYFQLTTLTNVCDINSDIPQSINDFLDYLCSSSAIDYNGSIYVIDNLDMSITYHFTEIGFPSNLFNVLNRYDVWPRPSGVSISFTGLV